MPYVKPDTEPGHNGNNRHADGDPPARAEISCGQGVIRVSDRRLIDAANPELCRDFVERVFRLPEISSVELNWKAGVASAFYQPRHLDGAEVLARLAAVIRGEAVSDALCEVDSWAPRAEILPRETWFRRGSRLTVTEVASESPGRVRLRHPALAGNRELAHRVEAELTTVHGVIDVRARPLTASLLVLFDPAVVDQRDLIGVVTDLVERPDSPSEPEIHPPAVDFGLANASVGLAAAGELAFPALLPASALLLVVSNASVIRTAVHEVRARQLGLPVLYTAIGAGTLGTGHFLTAAAMSWMLKFWRHRHRHDQLKLRRRLLPSLSKRSLFAFRNAGGRTLSISTDRLRAGDRILVKERETVPVDGRLLSGAVVVDERPVTGALGLTRKRPGELIFAGSCSVAGTLEVEVVSRGRETRAARLGRELAKATLHMPTEMSVTARGEAFARRAVVPTLAAAGVGLLVGDLATASAILRPDYATGPGLGASTLMLRDAALCAEGGVLVRDAIGI